MTGSDEVLKVFDINSDQLYSAAVTTWWVSFFVGFLGLLILTVISVVLASVLVPDTGNQTAPGPETALQGWVLGKSIVLILTALFIIPTIRGLNWAGERAATETKYHRMLANPVIGILLYILPTIGLIIVAGAGPFGDDVRTVPLHR